MVYMYRMGKEAVEVPVGVMEAPVEVGSVGLETCSIAVIFIMLPLCLIIIPYTLFPPHRIQYHRVRARYLFQFVK
jgi:hypothetical protein